MAGHKIYQIPQTEQRISPGCKKEAIVKIPVNSVKYGELTAASKLCCKSFGAIKDLCSYALSFQHLDQLFSPANHLKLERPRLLL